MKAKLLFTALAALALTTVVTAKDKMPKEKDMAGDTIAEQKGIRDPYIFRAPDGAFCVAMTDLHVFGKRDGIRDTEWERDGRKYVWGNNRGIVLARSKNMIHWTRTNLDFTALTCPMPVADEDGKDCPLKRSNFSEQKHGAVVHVTKKELEKLIKHWEGK